MSVKLISTKCPDCGASIDVEAGRKQIFCSYCGAKIFLNNENEYIYRKIDEAELRKLEIEKEKREEEHAELHESKKRIKKFSIILIIGDVILSGVAMLLIPQGFWRMWSIGLSMTFIFCAFGLLLYSIS